MTVEGLEREKISSIYLLYGEETYLLEIALRKIKKQFSKLILGINYIAIDENNINTLIQEINTPAFGYEKKLIIVKNTSLFKKEKKATLKNNNDLQQRIAKYIKENITLIKQTIVLVFMEEEIAKNELVSIIEKNGTVCNFEKLKPIEIKNRLQQICNLYGVNIEGKTLEYLIEVCGTSMQNLINEIRKLIEYAGKGGTITREDIDKLSIKELNSVIFDLTDNLGRRNIKQTLEILKELLYNKEPVQKILIFLYNHFRKIYIVKLAQKYNEDISRSLNLKPNQTFLVSKYKKQAEYFSELELKKFLKQLIDLDYKYKQGKIDINIGLESIICMNSNIN